MNEPLVTTELVMLGDWDLHFAQMELCSAALRETSLHISLPQSSHTFRSHPLVYVSKSRSCVWLDKGFTFLKEITAVACQNLKLLDRSVKSAANQSQTSNQGLYFSVTLC